MKGKQIEVGQFAGKLPFIRFGNGLKKLVLFPGLSDAVWNVKTRGWVWPLHQEKLSQDYTVYAISRRRGLPRGWTTADMANDYAKAFEEIGPASLIGISLGGHIAQHFAANFPQYVERLVIVCSAAQISEKGRLTPERWLNLASKNHWRELIRDVVKVTRQECERTARHVMMPIRMNLLNPRDFITAVEASLAHDGSQLLDRIQAPTLVIGGNADVYFPPSQLRDMAAHIAHATLHLMEGGHGAYVVQPDEFESTVLDFLHGHPPISTAPESPISIPTTLVTT